MRTLCDACESAAAILFCAADEAALCRACDEKVSAFFFNLTLNYWVLLCVWFSCLCVIVCSTVLQENLGFEFRSDWVALSWICLLASCLFLFTMFR